MPLITYHLSHDPPLVSTQRQSALRDFLARPHPLRTYRPRQQRFFIFRRSDEPSTSSTPRDPVDFLRFCQKRRFDVSSRHSASARARATNSSPPLFSQNFFQSRTSIKGTRTIRFSRPNSPSLRAIAGATREKFDAFSRPDANEHRSRPRGNDPRAIARASFPAEIARMLSV